MVAKKAVDKGPSIEQLIAAHAKAKAAATAASCAEIEARLAVINFYHKSGTIPEGSNTHDFADGSKLVIKGAINRKIDREAMDAVWEKLPAGVYESLVRWKPELDMTVFRGQMANKETAKIISEFVTETPGMPSIEFKPAKPKGKK